MWFFNFGQNEPKRAKIEKATLEKSCFTKSLVFFHCISYSKRKITKFSNFKNFGSFLANILAIFILGLFVWWVRVHRGPTWTTKNWVTPFDIVWFCMTEKKEPC